MRALLKGKIEVIELAPPAVQTGLTPGQATRPGYQPLDAFADEVMALFAQSPTPSEILVERVRFLRSEEHTSELQSLMRISYAVFCLKKKNTKTRDDTRSKPTTRLH